MANFPSGLRLFNQLEIAVFVSGLNVSSALAKSNQIPPMSVAHAPKYARINNVFAPYFTESVIRVTSLLGADSFP